MSITSIVLPLDIVRTDTMMSDGRWRRIRTCREYGRTKTQLPTGPTPGQSVVWHTRLNQLRRAYGETRGSLRRKTPCIGRSSGVCK